MPRTGWVAKALVLGLVLILAQGCVSVGKYDDLQDNYRRLQMQLNDANSKLAASEADLDRERALSSVLEKDIEALRKLRGKKIEHVEIGDRGQLIIAAELLFDSGRATVKKRGKDVLAKVAAAIIESGLNIRIDGHTDTDPIKRSGWESNHHLSAARALAVFKEFLKDGIPVSQMHIVGWGPNRPRASNATKAGKAKNRRVEIMPYKPEVMPEIVPAEGRLEETPLTPPSNVPRKEPRPKT